jgi:predicted transcriptional regulator
MLWSEEFQVAKTGRKPKLDNSNSHDRDQQILSRLARIEHKVDSFDQTQAFALRKDDEQHRAEIKKIFGTSKRRVQVYLATNGARSVQEIAAHLSMQRQNVGPDLKFLETEGLVELADSRGNKDIWAKKALDRSLRLTQYLCEEYALLPNGLAPSKKSATQRKPQ